MLFVCVNGFVFESRRKLKRKKKYYCKELDFITFLSPDFCILLSSLSNTTLVKSRKRLINTERKIMYRMVVIYKLFTPELNFSENIWRTKL